MPFLKFYTRNSECELGKKKAYVYTVWQVLSNLKASNMKSSLICKKHAAWYTFDFTYTTSILHYKSFPYTAEQNISSCFRTNKHFRAN